jgi:hypothetical protein
LVVVDKFSRYAHFVTLAHPFTALQVATTYLNNIFKLHGLPNVMISDRDKVFTSNVWQELFKLVGTDLRMSSAYHPQTDGQTERVNQCLETYLRCFVHTCPTKWSQWLALAEYWYNTSYHSSLGNSPFMVLYGHEPRHFGIDISQAYTSNDLNDWLQERALMQSLVRQHLVRAQNKMKAQVDKHRSQRSFTHGDSVYLKAQPYVQTSLAPRSSNKLAFRFFGPFTILERIGQSAYRLQLPPDCLIHPVFHVSQLKKVIPPATIVSAELPDITNQMQVPQEILGRRLHQHNDTMIPQALSTWEDEEPLRQRFPRAPAWGQAGSKGGRDVTDDDPISSVAAADEGRPSEEGGKELMEPEIAASKPSRLKKPSYRAFGPEWIN